MSTEKLEFTLESSINPPISNGEDLVVIGFVPEEGFQSCRYFNGSQTWQSMITLQTVNVTEWLKRIY